MRAQEAVVRANQEAATSGLIGKELAKHERKLRIAAGKARARQCALTASPSERRDRM